MMAAGKHRNRCEKKNRRNTNIQAYSNTSIQELAPWKAGGQNKTTTMVQEIQKELAALENVLEIKILYAVESGSRAWGFASTNSDWDVRFIYIHKLDWYLRIDEPKDNYEKILPNDIDLAGWELKKALKLFHKSNPPLLEWLNSPLVYMEQGATATRLRELMSSYFNPISCLHHYLHMAEGNYRDYLQKDMVRTKKYFYVLRPILACDWIHRTNTMAPMAFNTLVESQVKDPQILEIINSLLTQKTSGEELGEGPRIDQLNQFLEERIAFHQDLVKTLHRSERMSNDLLNLLFRETIDDIWIPE
jgi:uncharacterized protein